MEYYVFNIRIICLIIAIMLGLVLVYLELLKDAKKCNWFNGNIKKFKIIALPIFIMFLIFIGVVTYFSLAKKNDETHTVLVLEVIEDSGFGGSEIMTSYRINVSENQQEYSVSIHLLMPSKFKKQVRELQVGDVINIKYNKALNVCYYIEEDNKAVWK